MKKLEGHRMKNMELQKTIRPKIIWLGYKFIDNFVQLKSPRNNYPRYVQRGRGYMVR